MPVTQFHVAEKYKYLEGFGSYHQSEAIPGANPVGANSPQVPPYGLSTERISGSAFTAPRAQNLQTFLYRVNPSLEQGRYKSFGDLNDQVIQHANLDFTPNALMWLDFPSSPDSDWISSQRLIARSGDPATKTGLGYWVYAVSKDMAPKTVFFSSDGDYLVIPQAGTLDIQTELGCLLVRQGEIAVIPRGIRYRVTLPNGPARGYICELYQGHFQLPELGPIGSCSLANVRDFQAPTAHFTGSVDSRGTAHSPKESWTVINRYASRLFSCTQRNTPFDVAAWHGTYYPYKYDLARFSVIGSVLFDHPDPSIFTVLSAPSHRAPGHSLVDFAIMPPRWNVMEDTYWPPYFHRNTMSEFAAPIIRSQDPASPLNQGDGRTFAPFGAMLNGSMVPHGMDKATHEEARRKELKPEKVDDGDSMLFLLESEPLMGITPYGLESAMKKRPKL